MSVTLVDQDHIGWKSWKLIARTINPTPLLFVSQRPPTYSLGNVGKFWGSQPPPKTPITNISGTGKATNFKFGQNNNRVHQNKSPLKILEKRERGHIQGLPKFMGYLLLSQEQAKLRISNLASTFSGLSASDSLATNGAIQICFVLYCIVLSIRTKTH